MVQKYKDQPIVSAMAGYQRYFSKTPEQQPLTLNIDQRGAFSKSFSLYKVNGRPEQGLYLGNHILLNYYKPVGTLSTDEANQMTEAFSRRFSGTEILDRVVKQVGYDSSGAAFRGQGKIAVSPVAAAEEQTPAVGGKLPVRGKTVAQPVDITNAFGNFQVTTSKLEKVGHHGIYGTAGTQLQNKISKIRKQFDGANKNDDKMYQRMADEGFNYFKARFPQWNAALRKIQAQKKYRSGIKMRGAVAASVSGGGMSIQGVAADGLNQAVGLSTGFFNQGAAELTKTALGNMRYYNPSQGVSYTFVLDPYRHAIIQKFVMKSKPIYQWDQSALKKELTEVIEAYAVTDEMYKDSGGFASAYDVTSRRAHAHTAYRANKTATTTELMKFATLSTGAQTTNSGRIFPSIDMVHADKELSRNIKKVLLPQVRDTASKAHKKFSASVLGKPRSFTFGNKIGWAAPYAAFTDYGFEAFGE